MTTPVTECRHPEPVTGRRQVLHDRFRPASSHGIFPYHSSSHPGRIFAALGM